MIHPPHPRRSKNFKLFKPKFLEISTKKRKLSKIIQKNLHPFRNSPKIHPFAFPFDSNISTRSISSPLSRVLPASVSRNIKSAVLLCHLRFIPLVDGVVALWMGANLKFIRRRAPPPSALSLRGRDNCSSLERRRRRRRGAGQSVPSLPLPPCLFK